MCIKFVLLNEHPPILVYCIPNDGLTIFRLIGLFTSTEGSTDWQKLITFGPIPVGIVEENKTAKASSKDKTFAVPKVLNREEARDAW
ncbi:MAG: hypothetical protein D4Q77_02045 [Methanothrix sp.]|nr:MAG: hypothetical protein D4Q77_02045 [Methanothrix sp.]